MNAIIEGTYRSREGKVVHIERSSRHLGDTYRASWVANGPGGKRVDSSCYVTGSDVKNWVRLGVLTRDEEEGE